MDGRAKERGGSPQILGRPMLQQAAAVLRAASWRTAEEWQEGLNFHDPAKLDRSGLG
jgi:hypothetical protein